MFDCFRSPEDKNGYCTLHLKLCVQKANEILKSIQIEDRVGFLKYLEIKGIMNTNQQVDLQELLQLLTKFKVKLTED